MVPHPISVNRNRIPFCPGGGGPDPAEQFFRPLNGITQLKQSLSLTIFPRFSRQLGGPCLSRIDPSSIISDQIIAFFFLLDSLLSTRRIPDSLSFALFDAHISNTRTRNFRLNGLSRDDLPSLKRFYWTKTPCERGESP
jgi:hypothetical protein